MVYTHSSLQERKDWELPPSTDPEGKRNLLTKDNIQLFMVVSIETVTM